METSNILVTGADGILGNNLVRILLDKGYTVTALLEKGKSAPTLGMLPIRILEGDILEPQSLWEAFEGMDYVIHAAASTSIWPARHLITRRVNIEGTRNVLDAALAAGVKRMVHVGTANTFGFGDKDNPGDETRPYQGDRYKLDYMDSKYEAHLLVLDYIANKGLPVVIANPTFLIGPWDVRPSSGQLLIRIAQGKIPGYTTGGRNYAYVGDVARGVIGALEKGRIGESYILGGTNMNYKEFFTLVNELKGYPVPKMKMPRTLAVSMGTVMSFFGNTFGFDPGLSKAVTKISADSHYFSSAKAIRELDYPQTPLKQALTEAYDWLKENGYY